MKAIVLLIAFSSMLALWTSSATAQIISTSLPTEVSGKGTKAQSFHVMVSPVGAWDYKEVWFGPLIQDSDNNRLTPVGTVGAAPNSQILVAGEMAFGLGGKHWSVAIGGWYNKVSDSHYDFDGQVFYQPASGSSILVPFKASVPMSLAVTEGHVGLYYRSFGVQGGVVHSSVKSGGDFLNARLNDSAIGDLPGLAPFDEATTDWTCYGVYRKSATRWGLSLGLGAYMKQGVTGNSWLRFAENQTVASGFLTGNYEIMGHASLDASYWFIGNTGQVQIFDNLTSSTPSDAQSRMTLGVGYSF